MSRLQIIVDEAELEEIRDAARRQQQTVSEWVRQTLRRARREQPADDMERRLAVISSAARHEFPTADIGQMLAEVEQGYLTS